MTTIPGCAFRRRRERAGRGAAADGTGARTGTPTPVRRRSRRTGMSAAGATRVHARLAQLRALLALPGAIRAPWR